MQHLGSYICDKELCIGDRFENNNVFSEASIYDSIFRKIDIYHKNVRLINEGKYNNLPTIITYNNQERQAISEMLYAIQLAYLQESLKDVMPINESIDYINESLEDLTKKIKELCDKLSDDVKKTWEYIGNLAKKGISSVNDLIKALEKIFTMLGNNFVEACKKLGMYNDSFQADLPDVDMPENAEDVGKLLGDNDNKTNRYLLARSIEAYENKAIRSDFVGESLKWKDEEQINEGLLDFFKRLFSGLFGDDKDKDYKPFATSEEEIKKTTDTWTFRAKNVNPEDIEKLLDELAKKSNGTIDIIAKPEVEGISDNTPIADQYVIANKNANNQQDAEKSKEEKTEKVKLDKDNIKKVIAGANPTDKQQMAALGNALHTTPEQAASIVGTVQNAPEATKKKLGIGKILIGSIAVVAAAALVPTMGLLPIALLVGGYLGYKTLDKLAPSISAKLEPIFLSDKVKNLANKLYNNKFTRYGLGLQKNLNKDDYKDNQWQYWYLMFKNILIYGVITLIITWLGTKLFVALGVSAAVASVCIAAFLCVRNIFKILMNRTLKVSNDRDAGKDTKFIDTLTLVSLVSSLSSFAMSIPFVKNAVHSAVSWLWNYGKDVKPVGLIANGNASINDLQDATQTSNEIKAEEALNNKLKEVAKDAKPVKQLPTPKVVNREDDILLLKRDYSEFELCPKDKDLPIEGIEKLNEKLGINEYAKSIEMARLNMSTQVRTPENVIEKNILKTIVELKEKNIDCMYSGECIDELAENANCTIVNDHINIFVPESQLGEAEEIVETVLRNE